MPAKIEGKCSVEGCEKDLSAKGLCVKHYNAQDFKKRYSDPGFRDRARAKARIRYANSEQRAIILENLRVLRLDPEYRRLNVERERERRKKPYYWQRRSVADTKRRDADPLLNLALNLRSRLSVAVRKGLKKGSAVRDLGCTVVLFKEYIESQFEPGMTWDNWAIDTWHLDHYIPFSAFDMSDRQQTLFVLHHTNIRPIWAKDNLSKKDTVFYGPLPAPYGWTEPALDQVAI